MLTFVAIVAAVVPKCGLTVEIGPPGRQSDCGRRAWPSADGDDRALPVQWHGYVWVVWENLRRRGS